MRNKLSVALILPVLVLLAVFRIQLPSDLEAVTEKSVFFQTFPENVSGWSGVEIPADERTLEILETRNVLSREYTAPSGEKVHLLLVSSQKDRRVAHPPEVCYLGSNFNIVEEKTSEIDAGGEKLKIKEFQASPERYPEKVEEIGYLYKIGDSYTTNYYTQQLQFAFDRLTREETEVMLIRVAGTSREKVREFIVALLPYLEPKAV